MKNLQPDPANVFIVDDNPAVRDAIRWLVQQVGLNAKTYDSAQEFLAAFKQIGRAHV